MGTDLAWPCPARLPCRPSMHRCWRRRWRSTAPMCGSSTPVRLPPGAVGGARGYLLLVCEAGTRLASRAQQVVRGEATPCVCVPCVALPRLLYSCTPPHPHNPKSRPPAPCPAGWTGGPYGVGYRFKLRHTRAIVDAIHSGELSKAEYENMPIFNLQVRPPAVPAAPAAPARASVCWRCCRPAGPLRLPTRPNIHGSLALLCHDPQASTAPFPPSSPPAGAQGRVQRAAGGAHARQLLGGQGELHQDSVPSGRTVRQELVSVRGMVCSMSRCTVPCGCMCRVGRSVAWMWMHRAAALWPVAKARKLQGA